MAIANRSGLLPTVDSLAWASLHRRRQAGMRPRFVIVGNPRKPTISTVAQDICNQLADRDRAEVVEVDLTDSLDKARRIDHVDAYLVLGGDGTMLNAGRHLAAKGVPLVGIHLGRLGFLTAFTESQFQRHLDGLIAGRLPVSRRLTLECCLARARPSAAVTNKVDTPDGVVRQTEHQRPGDADFCEFAINDCAVVSGWPHRIINLKITVDGEPMTQIRGDGLIVATPSGSTAYNLSAGGPLLHPAVHAIVVTPVCPHSITHKPVVVQESSTIEVLAEQVNPGTTVLLDGQVQTPLAEGDRIEIKRGRYELLLARSPEAGDWQTWQDRLHWGRLPRMKR